jgi:hypothetical protein
MGLNSGSSDPFQPVEELGGSAQSYVNAAISPEAAAKDQLSPAEAIEHMRDVARLLHNWKGGSSDRQSA